MKYPSKAQHCIEDEKDIRDWEQKRKYGIKQLKQEYAKVLEGQVYDHKHKEIDIRFGTDKRIDDAREKIENNHNGLIPGLYNLASIGSRPIYRTGMMIANTSPIANNKFGEGPNSEGKIVKQKYNTITNQIPYVTTNPYILKQMQQYNTLT